MTHDLSLNLRYYGTEQAPLSSKLLQAGPLSAEYEGGNLRYIRYQGIEVLRAISFIVRDEDWGTYEPDIEDLAILEEADFFSVRYKARVSDERQAFQYEVKILGTADGSLTFASKGNSIGDFKTNRTGFVVLHPIDGVAGEKVEIEHVDGKVVESTFPKLIDPIQPMMELRRLTHWSDNNNLRVDCIMQGDTFEMEDQRNWTDASYKTYVRPLALPWPYVIGERDIIDQKVSVQISGTVRPAEKTGTVRISLGEAIGSVPHFGLGLDPDDLVLAAHVEPLIDGIKPYHLICRYDRSRGHNIDTLKRITDFSHKIGAEPWLEVVLNSVEDYQAEINALGADIAALNVPLHTIMISPAADLKCTLPGSVWPPAPPASEMFEYCRKIFPKVRLGGGMFSYFTELNRKRPPVDKLDFISFTTSALVHAGDDRSAMETLQTLPAIAESVKVIADGLPYSVGPSAIGMRDNPYGEKPKENTENIRQAMNRNDPRQRGLFGAVWALGYFAGFAYGGAQTIALGSPVGAQGAIATNVDFPQPYFDQNGSIYPVYHVIRGLAHLAGQTLHELHISDSNKISGLAASDGSKIEIWLANQTSEEQHISIDQIITKISELTAENFTQAVDDPLYLDTLRAQPITNLSIQPFSILRLL